jgi:SAM-dependent methyltransferase
MVERFKDNDLMSLKAYQQFWAHVGNHFPDLGGAVSTALYASNEQRLFRDHFAPLAGRSILKTDLWDEARNTRILVWAASQGARAYGIDISPPTVRMATDEFPRDVDGRSQLRGVVGDVRDIPFADNSVDAIYSMGTIEHFDATDRAIDEMFRVLAPGGRAIIGVPNRWDPFLRPLMSALLQAVGLYAYGVEKSYSRSTFRRMLEHAGFVVEHETAILFIPGWLRMLDLACHTWCRPLAVVTGALVWPFVWLDAHVPAVRKHGYLLATVVSKPVQNSTVSAQRSL